MFFCIYTVGMLFYVWKIKFIEKVAWPIFCFSIWLFKIRASFILLSYVLTINGTLKLFVIIEIFIDLCFFNCGLYDIESIPNLFDIKHVSDNKNFDGFCNSFRYFVTLNLKIISINEKKSAQEVIE